jgi:hypothetical protein
MAWGGDEHEVLITGAGGAGIAVGHDAHHLGYECLKPRVDVRVRLPVAAGGQGGGEVEDRSLGGDVHRG